MGGQPASLDQSGLRSGLRCGSGCRARCNRAVEPSPGRAGELRVQLQVPAALVAGALRGGGAGFRVPGGAEV
jgi:hypothetical protein